MTLPTLLSRAPVTCDVMSYMELTDDISSPLQELTDKGEHLWEGHIPPHHFLLPKT